MGNNESTEAKDIIGDAAAAPPPPPPCAAASSPSGPREAAPLAVEAPASAPDAGTRTLVVQSPKETAEFLEVVCGFKKHSPSAQGGCAVLLEHPQQGTPAVVLVPRASAAPFLRARREEEDEEEEQEHLQLLSLPLDGFEGPERVLFAARGGAGGSRLLLQPEAEARVLPSGAWVTYIGGPGGLVLQAHDPLARGTELAEDLMRPSAAGRDMIRMAAVSRRGSGLLKGATAAAAASASAPCLSSVAGSEDAPSPPPFRTLDFRVMGDEGGTPGSGRGQRHSINSRAPIPIRTGLFEGQALLLMRPAAPEEDGFYEERIFAGKKRLFECQIQGRFLQKPKGMVYIGAEITNRMQLGLLTRSLCQILLGFVRQINKYLHYSFGDSKGEENPHIVFPFWSNVGRMVVTPPGEAPPPLGSQIEEDPTHLSQRVKCPAPPEWDLSCTYTASFNSMYLDLAKWKLCNLPMMKDMDLTTFWSDSALRLVIYSSTADIFDKDAKHRVQDNQYLMCSQLKFLGEDAQQEEPEEEEKAEEAPRPNALEQQRTGSASMRQLDAGRARHDSLHLADPWKAYRASAAARRGDVNPLLADGDEEDEDDDDEDEDDEDDSRSDASSDDLFFDAEDEFAEYENGISNGGDGGSLSSSVMPGGVLIDRGWTASDWRDSLCAACVSSGDGKGAKSGRFFVFQLRGATRLRSAGDFHRLVPQVGSGPLLPPQGYSPRLSSSEAQRRGMCDDLAHLLLSTGEVRLSGESVEPGEYGGGTPDPLKSFLDAKSKAGSGFLQRQKPSTSLSGRRANEVVLESAIARGLSERHWVEEWAVLQLRFLSFYGARAKKPHFSIAVDDILRVEEVPDDAAPFKGFGFFEIHTLGRVFCVTVANQELARQWVEKIRSRTPRVSIASSASTSSDFPYDASSSDTVTDPGDTFLHKSKLWTCGKRRLLNCRRCFYRKSLVPREEPCALVERALRLCAKLSADDGTAAMSDEALVEFLDCAAMLKAVSVEGLSSSEKWAFFINLFHLMILHAQMVLGPPTTPFQWINYFSMVAYQLSDDIFSLAEVEHNILRAGMSRPKQAKSVQLISKFVLPTSQYSLFALRDGDFRLNFALNCGSYSNPGSIFVYRADTLDQQLDDACREYLKDAVTITQKGKAAVVTLPKICQWYTQDFGLPVDCVRSLAPFLPGPQRTRLRELMSGSSSNLVRMMDEGWMMKEGNVILKYSAYDFHCRPLKLTDEQ